MISTEQHVLTPLGSFSAMWDEDENVPVTYRGDTSAVEYFRAYLDLNVVSGRGGAVLSFNSLEPADLSGFCQSREFGILVLQDPDDLIAEAVQEDSGDE